MVMSRLDGLSTQSNNNGKTSEAVRAGVKYIINDMAILSNYFIEIISSFAILLLLFHSVWLQQGHGLWRIEDKEKLLKRRVRGERGIWIFSCLLNWVILSVFIKI